MYLAACRECDWAGVRPRSHPTSEGEVLLALASTVVLEPCPACKASLEPTKFSREMCEAIRQHIARQIGFSICVDDMQHERALRVTARQVGKRSVRPTRREHHFETEAVERLERCVSFTVSELELGSRGRGFLVHTLDDIVGRLRHEIENDGWIPE